MDVCLNFVVYEWIYSVKNTIIGNENTRDKVRRNKFYFNENPIAIMRLEKADEFIMLKKKQREKLQLLFLFPSLYTTSLDRVYCTSSKTIASSTTSLEAISTLLTSRTLQSLIISDASAKSIQSVCSHLTCYLAKFEFRNKGTKNIFVCRSNSPADWISGSRDRSSPSLPDCCGKRFSTKTLKAVRYLSWMISISLCP